MDAEDTISDAEVRVTRKDGKLTKFALAMPWFPPEMLMSRSYELIVDAGQTRGAMIPQSALLEKGGKKGVYMIRGARVVFAPVSGKTLNGGMFLVTKGISVGDAVVEDRRLRERRKDTALVSAIKENVERIRGEIAEAARRAGRSADEVRLMGVTKFHPLEMMLEAAPLLDLVGENRVQEAAEKRAAWPEGTPCCPWHLIGHLQRNKIRRALENFDLVESIDALETACSMDRVLREGGAERTFPIFIEVNMSREPAKSGVAPEEAERLLESIMKSAPSLHVEGLMTVAEDTDDEAVLRATFGGLRELRGRLAAASGLPLRELSMGMSGDFALAVEEGSTIVRVGSAIFGPRNYG